MSKTLWRIKTIDKSMLGAACVVPDCVDAETWMNKADRSKGVMIEPRQPRHLEHHKKLMAIIGIVAPNWPGERRMTREVLLSLLKIKTGHTEPATVTKRFFIEVFTKACGELSQDALNAIPDFVEIHLPKSINFESINQAQFDPFYEDCVRIMSEALGTPVETLSKEKAAAA